LNHQNNFVQTPERSQGGAGPASAGRLAAGIVCGLFIGLIPKDSLFAWLPCLVLLFTTASVGCAVVSAVLFSILSRLLDPFAHPIGTIILTANGLEQLWSFLYGLPVIPWTRFSNTVVMGQLVLAFMLAIPVYHSSKRLLASHGQLIHERLCRNVVYRWMIAPAIPETAEEA
jgi:uncharacterized protein (TIGR03546 family)